MSLIDLISENRNLFTEKEKALLRFFVWPQIKTDYRPCEEIAKEIGITERSLRGHGDDDGLRLSTSKKLFSFSEFKIISKTGRPGGMKLSNNPKEWGDAAEQIRSHLIHENRDVSHLLLQKPQPTIFEHPIVNAIKKEFDAKEVF